MAIIYERGRQTRNNRNYWRGSSNFRFGLLFFDGVKALIDGFQWCM